MMDKRMKKMVVNFVLIAAFMSLCMPVMAADDGYALLVQQSPPGGGSVNLGAGVHKMDIGQTVTLSAIPQSGYRFLYWLGDVSVADAAETSIQVDSPKMVVAVFARDEFDDEELAGGGGSGIVRGTGGGAGNSGQRVISSGGSGGGSISPTSVYEYDASDIIYYYDDDTTGDDEIQVPGDQDDIVVPGDDGVEEIPEPATLLLLGIGSTVLLKRKRY